jgi:hypothetical protein
MDIAIGAIYLFGPSARLSSPAFTVAKDLASFVADPLHIEPMRVWGTAFVFVGVLLFGAVYLSETPVIKEYITGWPTVVQTLGAALFVMWALMFLLSAFEEPTAGITGIPVYVYLAYRHTFAPARPRRA